MAVSAISGVGLGDGLGPEEAAVIAGTCGVVVATAAGDRTARWLAATFGALPQAATTSAAVGNMRYARLTLGPFLGRTTGAAGAVASQTKILDHVGLAKHHVLHKNFYMSMNMAIAAVAHQAGTCRFGTDPATSVLDVTARHTKSTTSTWPTPASSRASARSTPA